MAKTKPTIAIIGGGAAALSFCSFIDTDKFQVHLFEKNNDLGRKFLVAGKGGFNLTHSEPLSELIQKYDGNKSIEEALCNFNNDDFRVWLASIGIKTFIGTSGRVYPIKGTKPIEVLKAIKEVIINNGVQLHFRKEWVGWQQNSSSILFKDGSKFNANIYVYAFGGASWKVTGSDGKWLSQFKNIGIKTKSFSPSNCAVEIAWPKGLLEKIEGKPLKNITISCDSKIQKGEVVCTKFGLEGNAIYALSSKIKKALAKKNAIIKIDLKPSLGHDKILKNLQNSREKNITDSLKKSIKISTTKVQLLKKYSTKEDYLDAAQLSKKIKALPIVVSGLANIDEAISTTGGIQLDAVDTNFELKEVTNNFCVGEMLDWDAPTGGYLLQACFSMGYQLATYFNTSK